MSLSQKLKSIIKKPADKVTFGTNPLDPWSAKADINEDGSLNTYLKARGINPEFVSKDQKISHAKSTAFLRWKQQHMHEDIKTTPSIASKKKHIAQQAVAAHKEVKSIPGPGFHEGKGSQTPQLTPEETELEEGAFKRIATDREEDKRLGKMSALDKFRADAAAREKKHAEIAKKSGGMTAAIDRLEKHLNKEETEQIDELKKSTVKSWLGKQEVVPPKKPGMDRKAHNQRIKTRSKSWDRAIDRLTGAKPTSEDVGDPKAAVNADGLPNPQLEPVSEKKRQMSKSARMIKALYKKKGMVKEDLYDHEKEDKSVATYGKKPKMDTADKKESIGEKKPQAAATLSGGTTLTGSERDTVEIDPMMRNRPGQPDVTKKDDKKDDKKEDKKKDK